DFFDLTVNVAEPPLATVCAPPGVTWISEALLELALIERLVEELWPTLIVAVPSRLRANDGRFVVIVQTAGVGVGVAVGLGVGVGVGVVVVPPGFVVGSVVGLVPPVPVVGLVVGFVPVPVPVPSTGSVVPVPPVVSIGGVVDVVSGVGTEVAPAERSSTWRSTFGTSSSNTALSTVMSPEPVTSMETLSTPYFSVIETCAFDLVDVPTVFQVRPRQSKAIVSTVTNSIPEGRLIVRVSISPSPSRSMFTL